METLGFEGALRPRGSFLIALLPGAGFYGIRWGLIAGIAFLAWYGRRGPSRRSGKLQRAMPRGAQIRREIAYSATAVLVFGLVNGVIFGYGIVPHTQVYWDIAQYGWAYFWLSIPLMILLHDAYFYWTHMLLHTEALLRTSHRVHHLSPNPTPRTAYAFLPLASVV